MIKRLEVINQCCERLAIFQNLMLLPGDQISDQARAGMIDLMAEIIGILEKIE
jgi:hypothetical protein